MAGTVLSRADALTLIDKVRHDPSLSPLERRRAGELRRHASRPAVVLERLQREARTVLPRRPKQVSTVPLIRVVTAATFRSYLARPEVRESFTTTADFILFIDSQSDPDAVLMEALRQDPVVFPWERSWLAEESAVRGMGAVELNAALELDQNGPFVVFHFSVANMSAQGVTIREPCSLDSVIGPNLQWRPSGPLSGVREYVDDDIPRAAVTSLEWRH